MVSSLIRHRTTWVWAVLVLATLSSWVLSVEGIFAGTTGRRVTTVAILAVGFTKVRFIGLDFMVLRRAPLTLRLLFEGWVVVVFLTLTVIYLVR